MKHLIQRPALGSVAPIVGRLSWLVVLPLVAIALPAAAGAADAGSEGRRPVTFQVANPIENGAVRTIAGSRYDPPCGASTVVLLQHGLSYTKEVWDVPGYSVARALTAAGYAVIAIDRLGYGQSKLPDGYRVTHEAYADMTRQIVSQLRHEFRRVVLGGHSAGGGITLLTQGLFGSGDAIMVLGWHHRPSDEIVADFMTGDIPRAMQHDYEYFLGTPGHRAEMLYNDAADPDVVRADMERAVLTPSGEILTIGKQPSRFVAQNIRVPVFLQLAERDRIFDPKYADGERQLLSNSPSVTVDLVPAAGHGFMLHRTGPAATARLVDWLRARPEASACRAA
jgi:pimeloyl-ACP methyl ester carboxylesterase